MATQSAILTSALPVRTGKVVLPSRSAPVYPRAYASSYSKASHHAAVGRPNFVRSLRSVVTKRRVVPQAGVSTRADASGLSAKTTAATTPPPDLTQTFAVVGFLLVRFGNGSFDVDPGLILKSLASLQLLVAAVALLTRGVHSDRVSGVIGPCALALYALNYSRIPFITALVGLFGYNLSEQLPGPYYIWAISLAAALYYGYGSYWYAAGVSVLALWNLFKRSGFMNAFSSIGTIGVSAYVVYQEATIKWVMVLVSAQIAWSGLRTVLGGVNIQKQSTLR
ncbi:hypothetical protein ABBQ32_002771 [Trebouxia sp. C0010 RCD-2024]